MTQQLRWAVEAWKSKFCGATLSQVSDPAAGEGGKVMNIPSQKRGWPSRYPTPKKLLICVVIKSLKLAVGPWSVHILIFIIECFAFRVMMVKSRAYCFVKLKCLVLGPIYIFFRGLISSCDSIYNIVVIRHFCFVWLRTVFVWNDICGLVLWLASLVTLSDFFP